MSYSRRIVDDSFDALFPGLPAIAIEGAKGVGKTATASRRAKTTYTLDDEDQRLTLAADLGLIVRAAQPVCFVN